MSGVAAQQTSTRDFSVESRGVEEAPKHLQQTDAPGITASQLSSYALRSSRTADGSPLSMPTATETSSRRVAYRLKKDKWVVDDENADWYRNSLLVAVGFLDLTNGLDFPANVWNSDIPFFAYVLMGVFGAIALLWTSFAFWDLSRSLKNIRFLKLERAGLRAIQNEMSRLRGFNLERRRLIKAWLDVEYRELGWEYIDRAVMDGLVGFSGILVGTGTILAIGGTNDKIFLASNLLSGYIGNSFIAAYGVCNAGWSVFMWQRARRHLRAIADSKKAVDPDLRRRMRWHAWQHQIYATLNAISMLVGSAGSLVSSTMWVGYIILAPCVVGSIFCNIFWRTQLGYNRLSFHHWVGKGDIDVAQRLEGLHSMRNSLRSRPKENLKLEDFIATEKNLTKEDIIKFLDMYSLFDDFGARLLQMTGARGNGKKELVTMTLSMQDVLAYSHEDIVAAATTSLGKAGPRSFREQERFLLELYGCYLVAMEACKEDFLDDNVNEGKRSDRQRDSTSAQNG